MARVPTLVMVLLCGLAACAEGGPAGRAPGPDGQAIHADIMKKVPDYAKLGEPKVMAACIALPKGADAQPTADGAQPRTDPARPQVRRVFIHYTGSGSDRPIFSGELMHGALTTCDAWRTDTGTDCECLRVDSNGKNILPL